MQVKEIYNKGKEILINSNVEDANIKVRLLICHVLNIKKEDLIIKQDDFINQEAEELFFKYIDKIQDGYPLQYITNNQEFMKLNFFVDENVLIPRPDTEILVEEVIKIAKCKYKILDLCTGSGAIAVSLAKYIKDCNIIASDISKKALEIAKQNAKNNDVYINFINSDLFQNIVDKDFDMIVSNPPYIKDSVISTLSKEVKKEPIIALTGGEDGLDFYRKISKDAYVHLKSNGYLCFEIGYDQKEEIIEILKNSNYKNIYCEKDLGDNDRVIVAQKVGE